MIHTARIAIKATPTIVLAEDAPVAIHVTITGANGAPAPVVLDISQPLEATFQVEDGSYTGVIQAIRADGTAIGNTLPFEFSTPATVEALVPSSVTASILLA